MTPLRLQMVEDMRSAGLAPGTQAVYVDAVRRLAEHFRRSPAELTEDEVRSYLLGLRERGLADAQAAGIHERETGLVNRVPHAAK